jgi:SH3 domain-containing YSC84-like protein 1
MYEIIEAAEGLDETGLPDNAFVPHSMEAHKPDGDSDMVFDADH